MIRLKDVRPILGTFLPEFYFATSIRDLIESAPDVQPTRTIIPPASFANGSWACLVPNVRYQARFSITEDDRSRLQHFITDDISELEVRYENRDQGLYLRMVELRRALDTLAAHPELPSNAVRELYASRDDLLDLEQFRLKENMRRSEADPEKFLLPGDRLNYALLWVNDNYNLLVGNKTPPRSGKRKRALVERLVPVGVNT
jgi:hypothetical protein